MASVVGGLQQDLGMKPNGRRALVKQQKLISITAKPISSQGKCLQGPGNRSSLLPRTERSRFSDS
jgi:hypothetical protein